MPKVTRTRARMGWSTALIAVLALVAGVTAACSPTTTSSTTASQQFCSFYNAVSQTPPTDDSAVLVKPDVVAFADTTQVTGSSCTDSSANVALGGAQLAQGENVSSQLGGSNTAQVAAVTGPAISSGTPVLTNLSLQSLSASIGVGGISVRGTVAVTLSGTTSQIGFTGTLSDLQNWSVSLSSSALTIPGFTTSPVTFSGTLKVVSGVPSLALTASATSVTVGAVTVTGAKVAITATPSGVNASAQGSIKVGPSTASGTVNVSFDHSGALVSAAANVSAHLVGTQADGTKIDLTGTVNFNGNAQQTVASFTGSGTVGNLQVNQANGSLTLAVNQATFTGVLDVNQGGNEVRFDGTLVWNGITAYTPFLTVEGSGEFSGTLNNGQQVSVNGTLDTTIVAGEVTTQVQGAFQIGTLKATGSALVDVQGSTTTLNVDATLTNTGFSGTISGAIVITDGVAELVSLDVAIQGSVTLGDATLTNASLHIATTYGAPLTMTFSGNVAIGTDVNVTGSVDASFGPDGSLMSLSGQMSGSLSLDSWNVGFTGNVVASPDQVTLSGSGSVSLINFPLGITFSGSYTSSLKTPSWTFNGTGEFRIASIDVLNARVSLSQAAGMQAIHSGFYFSILGIPTYFEGNFYLNPGGGCSHVDITGGSILLKPLLLLVLPGVIGCSVD